MHWEGEGGVAGEVGEGKEEVMAEGVGEVGTWAKGRQEREGEGVEEAGSWVAV